LNDTDRIILDTKDLVVIDVFDEFEYPQKYYLNTTAAIDTLGTPLIIYVGIKKDEMIALTIEYVTGINSTNAVHWLTPNMTLGKQYPFMYSHSEPILARSLFPCQDSPLAKVKANGKITVPKALFGLMSGILMKVKENADGTKTYYYSVDQSIPTYALAIAAGSFDIKQISNKVWIYAEKEIMDAAATEFKETEKYLNYVNVYLI
jgi:leukotriene-A4 hydrolase